MDEDAEKNQVQELARGEECAEETVNRYRQAICKVLVSELEFAQQKDAEIKAAKLN